MNNYLIDKLVAIKVIPSLSSLINGKFKSLLAVKTNGMSADYYNFLLTSSRVQYTL